MTRKRGCARAAAAVVAATLACWTGMGAALAAPPEPAATGATAVVVLVGATAQTADLRDLLTELLGRKGVAVRLVNQPRFRAADLLASGNEHEGSVSVFVEVPSDRVAQLSFRGPRGERFLLRELGLGHGLDEVGREAVAQVVDSSVAVLLSGSAEGMRRDEASAVLANAPSPPPPPGTVVDRAAPPAALPSAAHATIARPAGAAGASAGAGAATGASAATSANRATTAGSKVWRGWLAPRYLVEYAGSDLGAAHGPGAEAALEYAHARVLVRARVIAERRFAQVVTTPEIDASVRADAARLLVELGWPAGARQTVALGLGLGADRTAIHPGTGRAPGVTPAAASARLVPMARAEARYEVGGGAWRVAAVLLADVALFRTHYDIDRDGVAERIATPWRLRPGAAVVLGWRL